jgi:uncharacterized membrane protein
MVNEIVCFYSNFFLLYYRLGFSSKSKNRNSLWFNHALIFSLAWNGLLLGILSMRQMEKIWELRWGWSELVFIYPVMCLNALGIYIGRYLRYNSWDVVSDPLDLSKDILYLIVPYSQSV